jgi:dimeric dUTPase (all-alpha-NTP-PPase superfamily)
MENQVEWERFKKIVKDLEVFIRVRQMRTIEDFTKHLLSFWLARIKNKGLITEEIEKKCLTRNHISVQLTMDEMIKGNREG